MTDIRRTHSGEETAEVGFDLARALQGGDLVLLRGQLGAGKSTFAAGMARALGARRWRGSPTFTLINEYNTQPTLIHVDLYRLSETDLDDLGLEEYVRPDSIVVVEWPERALDSLLSLGASRVVEVDLDVAGEDERVLRIRRRDLATGR